MNEPPLTEDGTCVECGYEPARCRCPERPDPMGGTLDPPARNPREVALHLNIQFGHIFMQYHEGDLTRCAYRGEIDLPANDQEALHIVWVFFQNDMLVESYQDAAFVEHAQEARGEYADRSLSAGDVIVLDGTAYAIESVGFKEVPPPASMDEPIKGPAHDQEIIEAQARNAGYSVGGP